MTVDTSNIQVISHSNIRIEGLNAQKNLVLYFDVFQMPTEPHDASILFITHDHFDHYSPEDAKKVINPKTIIIAPAELIKKSVKAESLNAEDDDYIVPLSTLGAAQIIALNPGGKTCISGVTIEAIPAYNVLPERQDFHPKKNKGLGYLVTLDGVRYFITGDTDQNPENEAVSCDVILVPVGGTFTCDPKEAAHFVNAVKPSVAIPTHYGTITGTKADGDTFMTLVKSEIKAEKKLPY